ncbi:MAG TPA: hypothetical protein VF074_10120 [Pyrinomonadaceae bacterium]
MQDQKVKDESSDASEDVLNDLQVAEKQAQQTLGGALSRNNPFDDNSHGTHVAGTIGASG